MGRVSVATVLLALLLAVRPASACQCGEKPPVAQAFAGADVVVLVRVSRVVDRWTFWRRVKDWFRPSSSNEIEHWYRDSGFTITAQVQQQWKGPRTDSLVVVTGRGDGDCGYRFLVGQTYLVYAGKARDGLLIVSICGRTMSAQDAGPDVLALDALLQHP